jgi:hypothetical protein
MNGSTNYCQLVCVLTPQSCIVYVFAGFLKDLLQAVTTGIHYILLLRQVHASPSNVAVSLKRDGNTGC